MKTVQISVERNFHILNDDRFIMEKISVTKEATQPTETTQELIDAAREDIVVNFKFAYPKVELRLNFDETINIREPNYSVDKSDKKTTLTFENGDKFELHHKSGTIEEQIDTSFDFETEVNKCTTLKELKTYKFICRSDEEKKAYQNKLTELQQKNQTV